MLIKIKTIREETGKEDLIFLLGGPEVFHNAGGLYEELGDAVGVAVAAGPPVLQVAVALGRHLPRDPDTSTTVGHSRCRKQHVI